MKKFVPFVMVVVLACVVVSPASASVVNLTALETSFVDAISGLSWIYNSLLRMGVIVFGEFVSPFAGFLYPVVLLFNIWYSDFQFVYVVGATLVNAIVGVPNFSLALVYNWTPVSEPSSTAAVMSSSAVTDNAVYTSWTANNWPASTAYAVISVILLILGITLNVLVRSVRIIIWIYRLIPVIGGH